MINTHLRDRRYYSKRLTQADLTSGLIESRNLHSIQSFEYDLMTVTATDIDESNNFMLVGLSNGSIDLKEIEDPTYGTLTHLARFDFGQYNINRVQWSPGIDEQIFSILDNHVLQLVDPIDMRVLDKYDFNLKTNWSEWNPNDRKTIAVCCSESQVRLVDVHSGSSVQTVILSAPSRLATHRATRCLWSTQDIHCLIVGDNEGYLHVYDTRHSARPLLVAGEERGQISGMSFTKNNRSIITSQGTENHLVQWAYSNCKLSPSSNKFGKRRKSTSPIQNNSTDQQQSEQQHGVIAGPSRDTNGLKGGNGAATRHKERRRRLAPLAVDAYIRCQIHVTDRHVYCPAPASSYKSKELYIYEIDSGNRIKTLKSEGIMNRGVYTVSSLLPDSLVIYVGGRGRLKTWTIDEGYQRKMEEKMRRYHRTRWDSDDEQE